MGAKIVKIVGSVIKDVAKDAGKAAGKATQESILNQLQKHASNKRMYSGVYQGVHEKTVEAVKDIPHDLPKAQGNVIITAIANAATRESVKAITENIDITTKEAAEETAAGAASDASAKHVFQSMIMKEQLEEHANLKADMKVEDMESRRYEQKEKENKTNQEVIGLMKEFIGTTKTIKEDILFNIKEGKTNPKYDICRHDLSKIETQLKELQNWIHSKQHTSTQPESASLSGELQKLKPFLEPLIAGMGNLHRLAKTRQQKQTREFTDAQLNSLKQCLDKVNTSFETLTGYMIGMKSVSEKDLDIFSKDINKTGVLHLAKCL